MGRRLRSCTESDTTERLSSSSKSKQASLKLGKRLEQTFLQRRYRDGQQACEKMPNIIGHSFSEFSRSVMSNSLRPHGQLYARPPHPSPTPRACSNSCPLSQRCHPTISSSVFPFSSCLQSFPASGSFQMSQFFPSSGQSIGVSALASVLPMNIQY